MLIFLIKAASFRVLLFFWAQNAAAAVFEKCDFPDVPQVNPVSSTSSAADDFVSGMYLLCHRAIAGSRVKFCAACCEKAPQAASLLLFSTKLRNQ